MGELEAAVMSVLWDRGGWLTPGEVHEALGPQRKLAYTTVMTILDASLAQGPSRSASGTDAPMPIGHSSRARSTRRRVWARSLSASTTDPRP